MSQLGIQISMDARQVAQAKKAVDDLGSRLDALNQEEFTIGGGALNRDAETLRQLSADITRLGNISRSGEAKGGILNLQQWKDAATLSARVGKNIESWYGHSRNLREELTRINQDLQGMQKASFDPGLSPRQRELMLLEIGQLEARRAEIDKELQGRSPLERRAELLRERATEYGGNISSYGSPETVEKTIGAIVDKSLKYGMALAGGFSILSLLNKSMQNAHQLYPGRSRLEVMGYNFGTDDYRARAILAERMGYSEIDLQEMMFQSYRHSGKTSTALTAMAAERGWNVSPGAVFGFEGALRQMSGGGDTKTRQLMDALTGMAKSTGNQYRVEEMLARNQSLLTSLFHSTGGRAWTAEEKLHVAGMQGSALKFMTQDMSYNESLLGQAHSALRSPGSLGKQLLQFAAYGGAGINTYDDLWEYRKRVASGIRDRRNLPAMYNTVRTLPGAVDANGNLTGYGKGQLADLLEMDPLQLETLLQNTPLLTGGTVDFANANTGSITNRAGAWAGTEGASYLTTAAGMTNVTAGWGKHLQKQVNKLKDAFVRTERLIEQGKFLEAAKAFKTDNPLGELMAIYSANQIGGPWAALATGAVIEAPKLMEKGREIDTAVVGKGLEWKRELSDKATELVTGEKPAYTPNMTEATALLLVTTMRELSLSFSRAMTKNLFGVDLSLTQPKESRP